MFQVIKSTNHEEKSKVTDFILRKLPDWFGVEEAIVDYVLGVKESDFYIAYHLNQVVGFVSVKINNQYTAEIYVIGILMEYQNKGLGKALLKTVEESLKRAYIKFLMVKTLGESHPDRNYKNTREFYKKVGFYPLQEIKEIWGDENPCLIMVKALETL